MSNKTTEEKIDYIYNHIKTEEKFLYWRRIFKIVIYGVIFWYMYYFYAYWFNNLKNSIIKSMKPDISTESVVEWLKNSSDSILEKAKDLYNKNTWNSKTDLEKNDSWLLNNNY